MSRRVQPARTGRGRLLTANKPAFWILAAAVFAVNALVTIGQRQWLLAAFQLLTAVLALVSAATAAAHRSRGTV